MCAAEELQCPSARRHTQPAAAAPPPRRDSEQQLWAPASGESRDGWRGAWSSPGSRAALLESDCEHDDGCRDPEMCSQDYKGAGPGSHWSLLQVMGGWDLGSALLPPCSVSLVLSLCSPD